jgi:uncharacterized damage-inducible protein DinB
MIDDLSNLYAYNRWADERISSSCRELETADYMREVVPGWASLHSTILHIAAATHVWARRFEGERNVPLLTEAEVPNLDAARELLADAQGRIERIIASTGPDGLAAIRTFYNAKGEPRSMPFWAALRHVVNHATYHRGQAASKLKRLGIEPPVTDLLFWAHELTAESSIGG